MKPSKSFLQIKISKLESKEKKSHDSLIFFLSVSLGKQRPILCHVGEKPIPENVQQTSSCNEDQSGTATPDPEEAAASSGFVAVNFSPVPQEADSQEWVMLEMEQVNSSGAGKPQVETQCEDKSGPCGSDRAENQSAEQQDGQTGPTVPSSPVLSQMAMPGTWLLGHRRLPGMLGPSVLMGRSQMEQVGLKEIFYKQVL